MMIPGQLIDRVARKAAPMIQRLPVPVVESTQSVQTGSRSNP
jgi:hypothetical protein